MVVIILNADFHRDFFGPVTISVTYLQILTSSTVSIVNANYEVLSRSIVDHIRQVWRSLV